MTQYVLDEDVLNRALEYLGKRPYDEVANIVKDIFRNAKPVAGTTPVVPPAPSTVPTPETVPTDTLNPNTEGGDENVQSESSETSQEATSQTTDGQEGDGQETKPSNQG